MFLYSFKALVLSLILLQPAMGYGQSDQNNSFAYLQLSKEATVQDSLQNFVQKIDSLKAESQTSLQIAVDFFSFLSRNEIKKYYELGSENYFSTLKRANFKREPQAIEQELNRLLPLVEPSTKKRWEQYLILENPRLFTEIAGYWIQRDAYPSTAVNERLVEHWSRISYARKTFTHNSSSPYGTDDRGLIYVRLGAPDYITKESIDVPFVTDGNGNNYKFYHQSGRRMIIRGRFEIWNYKKEREGVNFFVFGNKNYTERYGLQNSILDTFDYQDVNIAVGPFRGPNSLSEGVAVYGIMQRLRTYKDHYSAFFYQMNESIKVTLPALANKSTNQINIGALNNFSKATEFEDKTYTVQQMNEVPASNSKLLEGITLEEHHRFYRFLDRRQQPKYILAVAALPDSAHNDGTTYFTKNNLLAYDRSWELIAENLQNKRLGNPAVYILSDTFSAFNLFLSSELVGQTTQTDGSIVAATGKRPITLPEPLPNTTPFTVSDILLADEQQPNFENEIPVVPKLEHAFKKNRPMMIHFEAYGVPEGGYSFTYFFKKDRWLRSNKKIERTEITVLADKVKSRDSQLFSIDIPDFEPGTYELVFQYNPLENEGSTEPIEKKIEIEIKD